MIASLFRKSLPGLADLHLEGSSYQSDIFALVNILLHWRFLPKLLPFNVDVQKLLLILFCAHSSEDWLSKTAQNRKKKKRQFTASKNKGHCYVCLA